MMTSARYEILSKLTAHVKIAPALRMASSSSSKEDDSYYLAPTLASLQQEQGVQKKSNDIQQRESSSMPTISSSNDRTILIEGLATSQLGLNPHKNTRHAPMVYHERYSCPNWPVKHTFPMAKFTQTAVSLLNDSDEFLSEDNDHDQGRPLVLSQDHFYQPVPVKSFPKSFLSPPICPNFLKSFLSGSLSYEESRVVGFREQTSRPELIERTVLEVAGTVLTAQLAMKYGLASNLAGGTHHAESDRGKGFTIVNDLAVAARLMTWKESKETNVGVEDTGLLNEFYRGDGVSTDRVLVVDVDVHQGDGTATFSQSPTSESAASGANNLYNKLFTLDLHAANNYPHPKETCTYDIGLPDDCNDEMYLAALSSSLDKALDEVKPQLVLYNAGVDVYEADKLGRLCVSWEGMKQRDMHVIQTCVEKGIPVAAVVGGGYDNDVKLLGRRHALVHRVCAQIWREKKMWTRSASC